MCNSDVLKSNAYAQIYTLGLLDDGASLRLVEMARREVFGSTQFRTQRAAISKHTIYYKTLLMLVVVWEYWDQ